MIPTCLSERLSRSPDTGSSQAIGQASEKYGTTSPRKDKNFSGIDQRLVLLFHRMISFLKVPREQRQSREDTHRLLSQARVEFCAHSMVSDVIIVAEVYGLLHPGDNDVDPIDM